MATIFTTEVRPHDMGEQVVKNGGSDTYASVGISWAPTVLCVVGDLVTGH